MCVLCVLRVKRKSRKPKKLKHDYIGVTIDNQGIKSKQNMSLFSYDTETILKTLYRAKMLHLNVSEDTNHQVSIEFSVVIPVPVVSCPLCKLDRQRQMP